MRWLSLPTMKFFKKRDKGKDFAADQFLITPAGRLRDRVRAQAVGDEVRTVIAGYHWFTDWGRDTMIAFEGLALTTGRWREAGFIVRTFAQYVRDGLIPNMFPDGSNEGVYHTADATLWFFHAVDRYARVTGDRTTVRQLLPVLEEVAQAHLAPGASARPHARAEAKGRAGDPAVDADSTRLDPRLAWNDYSSIQMTYNGLEQELSESEHDTQTGEKRRRLNAKTNSTKVGKKEELE